MPFGRPISAKLVCAALVAAGGGCFAIETRPDFDSAFAPDRLMAIEQARADGDRSALDQLIRQLSDDDLLIRWTANDALIELTGRDEGFEPDSPERERRAAIGRWIDWRLEQAAATREDAG